MAEISAAYRRYSTTGDPDDLRVAGALAREATRHLDLNGPVDPELVGVTGEILTELAVHTGERADIDSAVAHMQAARRCAGVGDAPVFAAALATTHLRRYDIHRDPADLERCLTIADEHRPDSRWSPDTIAALSTTAAHALLQRFTHSGDAADLHAAVDRAIAATAVPELAPDSRSVVDNTLGTALLARFDAFGRLDDLERAVAALRGSLTGTGPGEPQYLAVVVNAANALMRLGEHTRDVRALDESISHFRTATGILTDRPTSQLPAVRANLGTALLIRGRFGGRADDIDESIRVLEAAVSAPAAAGADRTQWLTTLGAAWVDKHVTEQRPEFLQNAERRLREAVDTAPDGFWNMSSTVAQLALVLQTRGLVQADDEALAESVRLYRHAVTRTDLGHRYRPQRLLALARSEFLRAGVLGRAGKPIGAMESLQSCVDTLDELMDQAPEGHHTRSVAYNMQARVAEAQRQGFETVGARSEADDAARRARRRFRDSVRVESTPPQIRQHLAIEWAEFEVRRGAFDIATEAYAIAVEQIEMVVWRGLERSDQRRALSRLLPLAADAAAAAARAGQPQRAVELLERGRGVLLAQLVENRTSLDDVAAVAPETARRLGEVSRAFDVAAAAADGSTPDGVPQTGPDRSDQLIALARERDRLVSEIRTLPGFGSFLRPRSYYELRTAAAEGPIVMLTVSAHGSYALVVSLDGVDCLELPGLTPDAVRRHHQMIFDEDGRPRSARAIESVLDWMGSTILAPLVPLLGWEQPPERPSRLWWCPTGLLSSLPVHAATWRDADVRRSALDFCVPSYTPTVGALLVRNRPGHVGATLRPAVVGLLDGQRQEAAEAEVDLVASHLPFARTLVGGRATRSAVAEALAGADITHFACHARQDLSDPDASHLVLHDGVLTVTDLMSLGAARASLAVLLACGTAHGDETLPDEAVTMTAALLLAGFRSVIGTLWVIDDRTALKAATEFYGRLRVHDGQAVDGAQALHDAVLAMRADRPHAVHRWTCLVHTGR